MNNSYNNNFYNNKNKYNKNNTNKYKKYNKDDKIFDIYKDIEFIQKWTIENYKPLLNGINIVSMLGIYEKHLQEGFLNKDMEFIKQQVIFIDSLKIKENTTLIENTSYVSTNFNDQKFLYYGEMLLKYSNLIEKTKMESQSEDKSKSILKSFIDRINTNDGTTNSSNLINNMLNIQLTRQQINNSNTSYTDTIHDYNKHNTKIYNHNKVYNHNKKQKELNTFWGRYMENKVVEMLKNSFKFKIDNIISSEMYENNPNINSSCDGIIYNCCKGRESTLLEIKCPYSGIIYKYIKIAHYLQLMLEMVCYNKDNIIYCVWCPSGFVLWHVTLDRKLWNNIKYLYDNDGNDSSGSGIGNGNLNGNNMKNIENSKQFLSFLIRSSCELNSTLIGIYIHKDSTGLVHDNYYQLSNHDILNILLEDINVENMKIIL